MKKIVMSIISDIILIYLSFYLAFSLRFSDFNPLFFNNYCGPTLLLVLIYIISFALKGTFRLRFKSNFELFTSVFNGVGVGVIVGMSFIFLFRIKWGMFPSSIFFISFPILCLFVSLANMLIYKLSGCIYTITLFVGNKELYEIEKLLNYKEIDDIVLTTETIDIEKLYFLLNLALFKNAQLSILPEIYDKIIAKKIREEKKEIYTLPAYFKNRPEEQLIRLTDFFLSLFLLFFSLPLLILLSLFILVDSYGPIIYKQERIGINGKKFTLYKFRSMFPDVPLYSRPKEIPLDEDTRVTRVGKLIRKLRFDELPQFFNVLRGDMSLVGPRPEAIYRVEEHRALQGIRLSVKPGITGLAQIHGYYHTSPHHKLRYDYLYIRNRSLRFNLNILLKTALVVLYRPGS